MTYSGVSDIGSIRHTNEDSFIAQTIWDSDHLLCAVIDGIGGNEGGAVAAEIVKQTLIRHLEDFPMENLLECLQYAVAEANNEVMCYQRAMPRFKEMGCVMSAGVIDVQAMCLHFVHIGDTRIYTLQDGQLSFLTRDETQGRLITNYIGRQLALPGNFFCETNEKQLQEETTLLFCTDGLWKMIEEKELTDILSLRLSSEDICNQLIGKANENGGTDNITAVVVKL